MEGILKGFRIYVPGLVLQSVIVAGGYGTGREVVEYFTRHAYKPLGPASSCIFEFRARVLLVPRAISPI